jgi:hypothetical protein
MDGDTRICDWLTFKEITQTAGYMVPLIVPRRRLILLIINNIIVIILNHNSFS